MWMPPLFSAAFCLFSICSPYLLQSLFFFILTQQGNVYFSPVHFSLVRCFIRRRLNVILWFIFVFAQLLVFGLSLEDAYMNRFGSHGHATILFFWYSGLRCLLRNRELGRGDKSNAAWGGCNVDIMLIKIDCQLSYLQLTVLYSPSSHGWYWIGMYCLFAMKYTHLLPGEA